MTRKAVCWKTDWYRHLKVSKKPTRPLRKADEQVFHLIQSMVGKVCHHLLTGPSMKSLLPQTGPFPCTSTYHVVRCRPCRPGQVSNSNEPTCPRWLMERGLVRCVWHSRSVAQTCHRSRHELNVTTMVRIESTVQRYSSLRAIMTWRRILFTLCSLAYPTHHRPQRGFHFFSSHVTW